MAEEKTISKMPHQVILEERSYLSVSGVCEVVSFDENEVTLVTSLGELTVRGEKLHITKTNTETGELLLNGEINDLTYAAAHPAAGNFWSRVFR